jgi:hypothetical protein
MSEIYIQDEIWELIISYIKCTCVIKRVCKKWQNYCKNKEHIPSMFYKERGELKIIKKLIKYKKEINFIFSQEDPDTYMKKIMRANNDRKKKLCRDLTAKYLQTLRDHEKYAIYIPILYENYNIYMDTYDNHLLFEKITEKSFEEMGISSKIIKNICLYIHKKNDYNSTQKIIDELNKYTDEQLGVYGIINKNAKTEIYLRYEEEYEDLIDLLY